jgi:hypothetical protein
MAPLTNWKDTAKAGLKIEDVVAEEFGLFRNPDMLGTDLYHNGGAGPRTYVEIKSIGSKAIEYTDQEGTIAPKYMFFQITRKAQLNDENNWFPVLRPGGVFRTNIDTPNGLLVVRCPKKYFYDYWTSRAVTIPQCTYFYKAHMLQMKLLSLIYTGEAAVHRLYHKDKKHGFETLVKVEFEKLRDIELTRAKFVEHVSNGFEGMTSDLSKSLWMDVIHRYSIPCLRKVALYRDTFDALLSLDRDPVWRPDWWRGRKSPP